MNILRLSDLVAQGKVAGRRARPVVSITTRASGGISRFELRW